MSLGPSCRQPSLPTAGWIGSWPQKYNDGSASSLLVAITLPTGLIESSGPASEVMVTSLSPLPSPGDPSLGTCSVMRAVSSHPSPWASMAIVIVEGRWCERIPAETQLYF